MNLRELANKINEILKDNPQYGDCPVILPSDEEGNSYREAYYMGMQKYFDIENMELKCDEDVEGGEYDEEDIKAFVPVFCF